MDQSTEKPNAMIVKDGEVLAMLDRGVLYTVDLHCEEMALVWYSLLANAKAGGCKF